MYRQQNQMSYLLHQFYFLAVGSAYLAYYFGFSFSLGAFIAGMMIAETKFKHQVEADLIPFRNIY